MTSKINDNDISETEFDTTPVLFEKQEEPNILLPSTDEFDLISLERQMYKKYDFLSAIPPTEFTGLEKQREDINYIVESEEDKAIREHKLQCLVPYNHSSLLVEGKLMSDRR